MFECNCTHAALYAHYGKLYVCTVSDYDKDTFSLLPKLTGKGEARHFICAAEFARVVFALTATPARLLSASARLTHGAA